MMKLEFLDDISNGGLFKDVVTNKLVRLFDFDSEDAERFQKAIHELVETGKSISVHDLSFIKPINCSLTLLIGNEDLGIMKKGEGEFECKLTKEVYAEMIMLIQPFVDNKSGGYQWLYNNMAEIDFLFSPGGTW
jgi:hypothetical protein